MTKKEYIEKAKSLILNRVRFHAPVLFDGAVDDRVLRENGIDKNLPIFKFEKQLSKRLLKAFEMAQKEEKFNLVLSLPNVDYCDKKLLRSLKNMPNCVFLDDYSSKRLLEMVNKLNINYSSASNFNLVYQDKFFSVNGIRLNPSFQDFQLCEKAVFDDVFVDYSEFVLNGENIFAKFLNRSSQEKKLVVELNIPLKKGYYFFKKIDKAFVIENLISKEKFFFNFLCSGGKFSFSNVDGIENSVFCCINVKLTLTLKPKQVKFMFFNFGLSKFAVKNIKEVEKLKEVSLREVKSVFDVQVKTRNPKFDFFFNKTLPQKIWLGWLNGQADQELEGKYVAYRRLFVKGKDKISFVKFSEIGLKELGVFNGQYYKKIIFVNGDEKFLKVGRTCFYNTSEVTKISLCSKEPISLCLGR